MFEIQLHDKQIGDNVKETVAGRAIHAALEIGRDYSTWVKDQINRLKLIENVDYIVFKNTHSWSKNGGGQNKIEYDFTVHAALQIVMFSTTYKGSVLRSYFISYVMGDNPDLFNSLGDILDVPSADKSRHHRRQKLYLIRSRNLVKIGISSNPSGRAKDLESSSGLKAKVLHEYDCKNARYHESFLHGKYKEKRKYGEWFSLDESDISAINVYMTSLKKRGN